MSSNPPNLTPEEQSLGAIYFWLHQRAELLRQQKTAESVTPGQQSTDSTATHRAAKAPRRGNRIISPGIQQTNEVSK